MKKISGIYQIKNILNGKIYIGSSNDIYSRWIGHKSRLNLNKHGNPHLQSAWKKYGEKKFLFEILENRIPEKNLIRVEQQYLDNRIKWGFDYNIVKIASKPPSWRGKSHRKKTRRKMSARQMGEKNKTSILTDSGVLEIFSLYSSGRYTHLDLGKIFGVSKGCIGNILLGKTWKHIYKNISNKTKKMVANSTKRNAKNSGNRGDACPTSKLTTQEVLKVFKLYITGEYSQAKLGEMFGVNQGTIGEILRGVTWKDAYDSLSKDIKNEILLVNKNNRLKQSGMPGEKNTVSKLTEKKVVKIRKLRSENPKKYTFKRLGEMFGVDRRTIGNVISRKSWKHI